MVVQFIPIIAGILGLIGILLKNEFLVLIGAVLFFFMVGPSLNLPPLVYIIIFVILIIWIKSKKK